MRINELLVKPQLSILEIETLLSTDADPYLEKMAKAAHILTVQRFGRTIKLYAPVYLSNSCINSCLYCGFNRHSQMRRVTLTRDEVLREANAITSRGHRHLLLVAGEDPKEVSIDYLADIAKVIRPIVASLSVEVAPSDVDGYMKLADAGVEGVTLYQETYNEDVYKLMHPFGPKSLYGSRLKAIEAAGNAGMRYLGIGALLGLGNWREEILALINHARMLTKKFWKSNLTVSVPRLKDSASNFHMPCEVTDRDLAHIICVLRLALPDSGIALSTREPAHLRENLLPLGITQMSAGSVTNPGGYSTKQRSGEQFHIEDDRSPDAVATMLKNAGYDPVWKDGEQVLQG